MTPSRPSSCLKSVCFTSAAASLSCCILLRRCQVKHLIAFGQLSEHLNEFFEGDLAVTIDVNLCDNVLPDLLGLCHVVAQDSSDLTGINGTTSIFVKESERSSQVRLIQKLSLVNGRRAPLSEVDRAASINIRVFEHLLGALINFLALVVRIKDTIGPLKLVELDQAVPISVELVEGVSHGPLLLLGGQVARHEGQRRLLHFGFVLCNKE